MQTSSSSITPDMFSSGFRDEQRNRHSPDYSQQRRQSPPEMESSSSNSSLTSTSNSSLTSTLTSSLSNNKGMVCPVCGYFTKDKQCVHYGGPSCYSCRAFFRRAHQNTKVPSFKCKKDGNCDITVATRRKCQKCRYEKCIQAGMDPDLVLSDDQKKIRFRNYLKKKAETGPSGPDDFSDDPDNDPETQHPGIQHAKRPHLATPAVHVVQATLDALERGKHQQYMSGQPNRTTYVFSPKEQQQPQENNQQYLSVLETVRNGQILAAENALRLKNEQMRIKNEEARQHNEKLRQQQIYLEALRSRAAMLHKPSPPPLQQMASKGLLRVKPTLQLIEKRDLQEEKTQSVYLHHREQAQDLSQESTQESRIESIQRSYILAMAHVEPDPTFVCELQRFHSDENSTLSQTDFQTHVRNMEKQFKEFASQQEAFSSLCQADRHCLLTQNTSLFIHYIFARYINCKSGEEQMQWILDDNVPENLSSHHPNWRSVRFQDFNKSLHMFSEDMEDSAEEYEKCSSVVTSSGLVCQCTGLVANLLLFHTDQKMELEGQTSVNANFIEALDLLKVSHKEYGHQIRVEPILCMVKNLERMTDLFTRCADWKIGIKARFEPRLHLPNLSWFRCGWADMPLPQDLIREIAAFSMGVPVTSMFMPLVTRLFGERCRCMLKYFPEFLSLPEETQSLLWSRNIFLMVSLCLAKYEGCSDGFQQFRFLAGSFTPGDNSWRALLENVDPNNLKKCDIVDSNVSKRLTQDEIVAANELLSGIVPFIQDDDVFMMLAAVGLFSGCGGEFSAAGANLPGIREFFVRQIENRVQGISVEKIMRNVTALTFIVSKFRERNM